MKCDMCGNERAVVFVQQTDGDSRDELRLCSECAKSRGLTRFEGELPFSVKDLFENLPDQVSTKQSEKTLGPVCPGCSSRLSDLKTAGRAGCAICYETFADELYSRHGGGKKPPRHVGRIGVMKAGRVAPGNDVPILRERLRLALAAEDFETAALCRDRIFKLEISGGA